MFDKHLFGERYVKRRGYEAGLYRLIGRNTELPYQEPPWSANNQKYVRFIRSLSAPTDLSWNFLRQSRDDAHHEWEMPKAHSDIWAATEVLPCL